MSATTFPNKYAAHCANCKHNVQPGEGTTAKENGKWVVRCADTTKCAQLASTPAADHAAHSVDLTTIPEGVYAHDGRLYQVDHPKVGEWHGWTFVKRIDMVLTASGKVKKTKLAKAASARPGMGAKFFGIEATHDIAAIVDDPLAAAKMVGQTTGICGRCSAALSDPVSVERGIGPVCWKHWNL